MMIFFENPVEVKVDSYEGAVQLIERITAQPRDRWHVEAPVFTDNTTRWLVLLREYDDEPDLQAWYECYENPGDKYMYFVTTFRRGSRIDKQHIVKYAWD